MSNKKTGKPRIVSSGSQKKEANQNSSKVKQHKKIPEAGLLDNEKIKLFKIFQLIAENKYILANEASEPRIITASKTNNPNIFSVL